MWTTSTGGYSCPQCGYSVANCWGHGGTTFTIETSRFRNWREEDEDVEWPVWWQLIIANGFRPDRLFAPLLSLVRLWPQARAPPVTVLIS